MKKISVLFSLFIFTLIANTSVSANESLLASCNKNYPISADNLYLLTLSAINSTGQYEVIELQSKSGYIMFKILNKNYIATISKEGANTSSIKILPANSDFSSDTSIQKAIFDTIDLNINNIPQKVL